MAYTKEKIEKYLEILKSYNITPNQKRKKIELDVVIAKAIVFLLN